MITVIQADITKLDVDAIVNAANSSLSGGGGVDGAIHHAAGPELLRACKPIGGCPTGEARITAGFSLNAKWVIHTVGPIWAGGNEHEDDLLRNAYFNSLELALEYKVKSIAFPAVSTGIYGFPKEDAARIAISSMRQYEDRFREIVCCCFSRGDKLLYEKLLFAML